MHGGHESVPEARQGLYIARLIGRIAERLPDLIDGRIEAMLEVTSSYSGPEAVAKIFTGYHVAGPIEKPAQNLARLWGEFDSVPVLAQFSGHRVEFKRPKDHFRHSGGLRKHSRSSE